MRNIRIYQCFPKIEGMPIKEPLISGREALLLGLLTQNGYHVLQRPDGSGLLVDREGSVATTWSEGRDMRGEAIEDFVLWSKETRASGKKTASDVPSWIRNEPILPGESGKEFAKRVLEKRYGEGNYKTGPKSEYNQAKKWVDRKNKR